jgi:hypothetical protein
MCVEGRALDLLGVATSFRPKGLLLLLLGSGSFPHDSLLASVRPAKTTVVGTQVFPVVT